MKCPICNKDDDNINLDPRDGSWTVCYECASVIADTAVIRGDDDEYEFIEEEVPLEEAEGWGGLAVRDYGC